MTDRRPVDEADGLEVADTDRSEAIDTDGGSVDGADGLEVTEADGGTVDRADDRDSSTESTAASTRPYGTGRSSERLRRAFVSGSIPVAVYGLGKMGLPLAAVFAETTGTVLGVDIDPDVVATIQAGDCHVKREPGLDELVAERVSAGALEATTNPREAARRCSVHVVIVPTPITDERAPDLSILDAAIEAIGTGLDPGDLVLVECTVPPRTTSDRVLPALEAASGLSRGTFGVAFCPERTSSGRALEDIRGAYPKVVGGVDAESTASARAIYETINDEGVIAVSDATTAECVKVFEGLYRDVNIALANELATFTDEFGIDIREAIDVANTQPYCDIHEPGPGVGGHCIPFYPYFVIDPFETEAPLLETARAVNDSMPAFTVEKLRDGLEAEGTALSDATVLVLGLTYRPGVEETRASPSIDIAAELSAAGATVYGVDPMLESDDLEAFDLEGVALEAAYDLPIDGVILVTPHEEFEEIRWADLGTDRENELSDRRDHRPVVVDGRGTVAGPIDSRVYEIGGGVREERGWDS
ncbi:nucleotide sugar dehydrogenase [Natronosalvus caseinilyticus]|uniref:nucleotide sugar dehydrogenase n=1 Tax=Natronosalvus caseinilyticus TaxID=2953747 RepID=UPI0028AAD7DF|nr:nucleotide sugar dehydrogenase [Natronosalvus caseinilyticus]